MSEETVKRIEQMIDERRRDGVADPADPSADGKSG
jgi:hypothetical protein